MTSGKVTYTRLGSSGLRISNPILGAMSYGATTWLPWCLDAETALPLLKSAYDQGINTWDTANNYSQGQSERIIAQAIKTYAIPREKLVIMTKCHFPVGGECSRSVMDETRVLTSVIEPGAPLTVSVEDSVDTVNQHGMSLCARVTILGLANMSVSCRTIP